MHSGNRLHSVVKGTILAKRRGGKGLEQFSAPKERELPQHVARYLSPKKKEERDIGDLTGTLGSKKSTSKPRARKGAITEHKGIIGEDGKLTPGVR